MLYYETGYGHRAIRSELEVEKMNEIFRMLSFYARISAYICRTLGKRLVACVLFNVINNQHLTLNDLK
jgi:hypothetical protein